MNNINSVCFISEIGEILPIEGADKIEIAKVKGWSCIVQKGTYRVGDLVIVATTDAVIPQSMAESMNVINYLRKGNRVKTVKLRGVYSECLLIPTRYIPFSHIKSIKIGDDMMEVLSIIKWEPPVKQIQLSSGRKVRYHENPNFQIYYKFPNQKNVPDMFTAEDMVQITRKVHGTNARYGIVKKKKLSLIDRFKIAVSKKINPNWAWAEYEFVVGSHNVEKGSDSQGWYDTNVWYEAADKYDIKNRLWNLAKLYNPEDLGIGLVIYGEIYGKGIQKGYDYGLDEIRFEVFDMTRGGEYFSTEDTYLITTDILKLPHVDVLYVGPWSKAIQDKYVFDNFINETKVPHEGVVVKSITGNRQKVSKVINPDYLIYGEKNNIGDSH